MYSRTDICYIYDVTEIPTISARSCTTVIQYHFMDLLHHFCCGHLRWSNTGMIALAGIFFQTTIAIYKSCRALLRILS